MDKMREEFERWCAGRFPLQRSWPEGDDYEGRVTRDLWQLWQHLYPMVEAAYREGHEEGFSEAAHNNPRDTDFDWSNSTAKARLEGKDD